MGQTLETLTKPHAHEEDTKPTLLPGEALKKLIYPKGKGIVQDSSAVGEAIRKILTRQKTENMYEPTFEDVLVDMDPEDLKVIEKLREEIEKRG